MLKQDHLLMLASQRECKREQSLETMLRQTEALVERTQQKNTLRKYATAEDEKT